MEVDGCFLGCVDLCEGADEGEVGDGVDDFKTGKRVERADEVDVEDGLVDLDEMGRVEWLDELEVSDM